MFSPRKSSALKNIIFLLFFIILFMMEYLYVSENNRVHLLIPRLSIIGLIFFYYISARKRRINSYFILYLLCLFPINTLFSINDQSITAMWMIFISRALLVGLLLYNFKFDKHNLLPIFSLFAITASILLWVHFKETSFFYLSIVITSLLVVLLTITFNRILTHGLKRGNLEAFLAMCSFLISDVFFGSEKLDRITPIYLIFGSLFYYVAYFLLTKSVLLNKKLSN